MGRLIGSVGLAPGSDEGFDLDTKGQVHTHNASSNSALSVGDDDQVLTADSSATNGIKWATASGGGNLELISHNVLGADASSIDVSFTSINQDDISELYAVYRGESASNTTLQVQINGLTASNYDSSSCYFVDTSQIGTGSTSASSWQIVGNSNDNNYQFQMHFTIGDSGLPSNGNHPTMRASGAGSAHRVFLAGGAYSGDASAYTQLTIFAGTGNLLAGSSLDIFKVTNS